MLLLILGIYRYEAGVSSSTLTPIPSSVNIVKFKTCKGQTRKKQGDDDDDYNNNNNM